MGNYNQIAGQNLERISALSDGIFAVAMTLLVLDLRAPTAELIHDNAGLINALRDIVPQVVVFFMSFITLGIFWIGQQTQLNNLTSSDRDLTWLHLLFLVFVTLTPFSTDLMGAFIQYRLALLVYWGNILLLGAALFLTWRCAMAKNLVKPELSSALEAGIERRIIIAQSLYAFGAALCVINTYCSLGFIVLVQMNYVFAPRIFGLNKI
ncbi:MAG: TMEM175 family protein [Acidocella sp.]|nr:TMEM175 family protein [Acidocella sp.]